MKGARRALRRVWLPQGTMLLLATLLLWSSVNPAISWAAVMTAPIQLAIQPKQEYQIPTFSQLLGAAVPKVSAAGNHPILTHIHTMHVAPTVDCTSRACIALSFDDGPNPITTPQVLATLESHHVTASFFLVGKNIVGNESIVRRMALDSFEIGNHSWSHRNMTRLTPDQIESELLQTQTAIAATGAPLPTLFRPPYGAIDQNVVAHAGLQTALWDEDPRDWQATDAAALAQKIVSDARPGGIVDLHDIHKVTVAALPAVIDQLQAKGYQFVTVSQLLHSRDRPGNAPFYGYKDTTEATPVTAPTPAPVVPKTAPQ